MPFSYNVWSLDATYSVGTVLYIDNCFNAFAPDGKYSNGIDVYTVSGGLGVISTITSCNPPATVTINWDVREVGSGAVRLIIKDSTNTIIVDQESQNTGPVNGSTTTANIPFSVQVTKTAGTEVAQYRICNDSNSTQVTSSFSISTTETYVVSPTPLTTSIFATYGDSNTPINCSVA